MSNNKTNSSTVYVDLDALTNWSNKIDEINERATGTLNSLLAEINDLNTYWVGNIATGFIKDTSSLVEDVKKNHSDMKTVPVFLREVINQMDNQ